MKTGEKVTEYNEKTGSMMSATISDEDFEAMKKVDKMTEEKLGRYTQGMPGLF